LKFKSITDGLSNTIFVGEKHVQQGQFGIEPDNCIYNPDNHRTAARYGGGVDPNPATNSNNNNATPIPIASSPTDVIGPSGYAQFGSYHPQTCHFVFGDGSVHGISTTVDNQTLSQLCSRFDGNTVDIDSL